ncbi:MAG: hypothetical protein L3J65_03245 [Robiginitomaculum sp.]|nr:hypothetical protein [Robiginitomaculum sp.]
MKTNTDGKVLTENLGTGVPANAARDYITDMLQELCTVASQSGQEDLHVLLKLATQAARNSTG